MKPTKELYQQMQKQKAPKSKTWKNLPLAFLFGGLICALGEGGIQLLTGAFSMEEKTASSWISLTLVLLSTIFTGLGWYAKLAKHAGAGTLVPITGFANSVVSSAIESRSEGWILGIGTKIFAIAGPVILYGTVASVLYGIVYFVWQVFN